MNDEELYELYKEFYTEEGIPFPGSSKEDFLEWVKNQERYVIAKGKRERCGLLEPVKDGIGRDKL